MTKRSSPLFKKLLAVTKQKLQRMQNKFQGLLENSAPALCEFAPIDGIHPACTYAVSEEELVMEQKTVTVTQWALDDNVANNEKNKKITMVEVEFFPNEPYEAHSQAAKSNSELNYTIAGEDPNLRITHYPSSDRLH